MLVQAEEDLIDLREGILGKGLVKHGDKGLLHAWLALREGVAKELRGHLVEDQGEKLPLEAANVAQSDSRRCSQVFIGEGGYLVTPWGVYA